VSVCLQGLPGHGFYDNLTIPIIENTARECELTDRLCEAIKAYPRSNAVLVRRHGIYVWGDSWIQVRRWFPCNVDRQSPAWRRALVTMLKLMFPDTL
jgi:ribulose-5-phosphate 4-epimerase/fuculose-1-phosphate aldolase